MNKHVLGFAAAGIIFTAATTSQALINPNFTPVEMVASADIILVLKVPLFDDKGKAVAEVREVLKQPKDAPVGKTLTLDLKYARKEHIPDLKKHIAGQGDQPVLLFAGKGENAEDLFVLHTPGKWIEIDRTKDLPGSWDVLSLDVKSGSQGMGMEATWAGGTDGLLGVTRLLLAHPDMSVPANVGAGWSENMQIAKVDGKISRMMGVDLAGKGETLLFVASDAGDKIYQYNQAAKNFDELSAKRKLTTKTRVAAWGDFNGDGKLDLASSDGRALTIASQGVDGTFAMAAVADLPDGECVSLQTLDVGAKGRAGLVWWGSGKGATLLLPDLQKTGVFVKKALPVDPALVAAMGPGGKVLVADFDGDALADVLQVGASAGILYPGKGAGEFKSGVSCAVSAGPGLMDAFLGDWDGNGKPDVFTVCDEGCRLWQNEGAGNFVQMIGYSGEVAYISKPRGVCGNTCDINNDGRQDVFIAYAADTSPQIFFNRLFRSFGHAHQPIDINELQLIPESMNGQQAGVVVDLTGDGAQDMAFALLTGEVYVFPRATDLGSCLAARVTLAPGLQQNGPVTVTSDNGIHAMGAWVVQPGVSEAFLGRASAGELNVSWQLPGAAVQKKKIVLDTKCVRVEIP